MRRALQNKPSSPQFDTVGIGELPHLGLRCQLIENSRWIAATTAKNNLADQRYFHAQMATTVQART
jgi:hypothetical protein